MNTKQALTNLRKILGHEAVLRDSKRPSSEEQRTADRERRMAVKTRKDDAESRMKARREFLLSGDAEYQAVKAEYTAVATELDTISIGGYYRYEALSDKGFCYCVEAQADTLEELIAKVEAERVRA